jgi:hypothetical protein
LANRSTEKPPVYHYKNVPESSDIAINANMEYSEPLMMVPL